MKYFEKLEKNPYEDLKWNIPERKQGIINVVGGNAQSFRTEVKVAEFLAENYPLKAVGVVLPNALQGKLPPVPGLKFLQSTESGSFADSEELAEVFNAADYSLLMGDLSKNAVTGRAVASACEATEKPLLITRDSVGIVTAWRPDVLLMNENAVFLASLPQLIALMRSVYYPKMLTLSQSLMQVVEALHKFTLSYPAKIITLHSDQILIAENGIVKAVPLAETDYSPLTFWLGEPAAKIAVMNLYNPNNFIKATVCAIF